jgi:hypothetical protein
VSDRGVTPKENRFIDSKLPGCLFSFEEPVHADYDDFEHDIYVLVLLGTFESLGILVCRREMDIRLVEVRDASNRHTYYEWFQWLHE